MDYGPTSVNTVVDEFSLTVGDILYNLGVGFSKTWRSEAFDGKRGRTKTMSRILFCGRTRKSIQWPRGKDDILDKKKLPRKRLSASPTVGTYDAVISHRRFVYAVGMFSSYCRAFRGLRDWAGGGAKTTEFRQRQSRWSALPPANTTHRIRWGSGLTCVCSRLPCYWTGPVWCAHTIRLTGLPRCCRRLCANDSMKTTGVVVWRAVVGLDGYRRRGDNEIGRCVKTMDAPWNSAAATTTSRGFLRIWRSAVWRLVGRAEAEGV